MRAAVRFVAIGDSFAEGVGDELPDGRVRGWADLAAQGLANALGETVAYANFAVRGRLARAIVADQLEPALALGPTHLSFNGGGNDLLRPGVTVGDIADLFEIVVRRCHDEGVTPVALSGANPTRALPLGRVVQRRGDALSAAVFERFDGDDTLIRVKNWEDEVLAGPSFWAEDRLHLNARGHHRVAARVVEALGSAPPASWWDLPGETAPPLGPIRYYQRHVAPWLGRRIRGRSSGDGRRGKFETFVDVVPERVRE